MKVNREHALLGSVLRKSGVSADGVIVVHSAIAPLSRRGFRAEAMIEAFLDYMAAGTVVMPTMTWRTVTPEKPVWNEQTTRSETGIMTEIFRTRYASCRSIHPTHSVAAFGPAAAALVASHHLDNTPVSLRSPYGLMRGYDAFVMLLGVGLESCTAIHLPEEVVAADVYVRPPESAKLYACTDRRGMTHSVRARRHWRLDRDFPRFGPLLAADGSLHSGDVEGCSYIIVRLADLLKVVTAALESNCHATLRDGKLAPVPNAGTDRTPSISKFN